MTCSPTCLYSALKVRYDRRRSSTLEKAVHGRQLINARDAARMWNILLKTRSGVLKGHEVWTGRVRSGKGWSTKERSTAGRTSRCVDDEDGR